MDHTLKGKNAKGQDVTATEVYDKQQSEPDTAPHQYCKKRMKFCVVHKTLQLGKERAYV